MENARAFVFAAEEDFGIVPVEAQACGTPVIAYGRGGATETVVSGTTGLFFQRQEVDSLKQAVRTFEDAESQFTPAEIRAHAEHFDVSSFRTSFLKLVQSAYARFEGSEAPDPPPSPPSGPLDRQATGDL
jgi:glycosyltransferase involved in cell wall biosynthesis